MFSDLSLVYIYLSFTHAKVKEKVKKSHFIVVEKKLKIDGTLFIYYYNLPNMISGALGSVRF